VGITAIKKGSFKLIVVTGFIFAAAFSTKLYAAFTLIPLAGYFLYFGPKKLKNKLSWVAAFTIPVFIFTYLWYQTITGLGLLSIFGHTDFNVDNPSGFVPTYFFATNFLVTYGLGWFFVDAAILSLMIYLVHRHLSRSFLVFDAICVAVIVCTLSVNTILGTVLDLKAPFLDAVKYDFQTLPFFSFLAASLIAKSISFFTLRKIHGKARKFTMFIVAAAGFFLVAAAVLYNMRYIHTFSTVNYLIFRVEPTLNLGYSLFNATPIAANSLQMLFQYAGFAFALSGVVWMGRNKIKSLIKL
jgi:hypothetical protein